MKQFYIEYRRNDMPSEYRGAAIKWAHTEKDAVKLILQKAPDKDGYCTFKRGGSGKIISVQEL
jgi:hypothetical protein